MAREDHSNNIIKILNSHIILFDIIVPEQKQESALIDDTLPDGLSVTYTPGRRVTFGVVNACGVWRFCFTTT